jgi:hypothetical protein
MFNLDPKNFLQKETSVQQGIQDSRGPIGIFSRGNPIYNGGSASAHNGGGPQFGRPPKDSPVGMRNAISRRLGEPVDGRQ